MKLRRNLGRYFLLAMVAALIAFTGYGCDILDQSGCGWPDSNDGTDTASQSDTTGSTDEPAETATDNNSDTATESDGGGSTDTSTATATDDAWDTATESNTDGSTDGPTETATDTTTDDASDQGTDPADDGVDGSGSLIPKLTPFGVSMSHSSRNNIANWAGPMANIGIGWTRGWQPFGGIEPERGTFVWDGCDKQIEVSKENNLEIIGMFNSIPSWLESPLNFPVRDLDAWADYVTQVVNHNKHYVKYWEVWNEPPNFCKGDACSPEDYAQIVITAYNAAKAADPDCQVGLAAKAVDLNYLDRALLAGAADHFDFVTLHPYEMLASGGKDSEPHFMGIVATVRKMLEYRSPANVDVPIVFTEIGTPVGESSGNLEITEAVQGHYLVKAYTMSIAQGVDCILWFEGKDGDSGPFGLLTKEGAKRPAYTAMAQMINYLGEDPVYVGWVLLNDSHYAFVFQGATGNVMVTWSRYATITKIDFGQLVKIIDPNTGQSQGSQTYSLTNAPVIVADVPPDLLAQALRNGDKPFPSWDGNDYTNADAVSLEMGEANLEKGLHHMHTESHSEYTDSPYGPARFCGKSSTQSFEIDPNFLSYDTVPVKVTAVVRRNEANDNAGFNLYYESTLGYKNHQDGWYTIPGNDQWYTKTWIIDDAQFVGKYAYNFALRSDSTQYSQYYLKSLTVEYVDP